MKTTTKNTGIKVITGVKAGGFAGPNHSRSGLKVRSALKAGKMIQMANHNRSGLKVRSALKAGKMIQMANHNRSGLKVRSALKAGKMIQMANHNARVLPLV